MSNSDSTTTTAITTTTVITTPTSDQVVTIGDDDDAIRLFPGPADAPPPFDDHTFFVTQVFLRVPFIVVLCLLGLVTNVINVVIFYRQGLFADRCTATLAALAVNDFCISLCTAWAFACQVLLLFTDVSSLPWDVMAFFIRTAIFPKITFTKITCWLTAFLAFERFFSVVFPFQVKAVFTPKLSSASILAIFVVTFLLYIPINFDAFPGWRQVPGGEKNRTVLTYLAREDIISPTVAHVFAILNPIGLHIPAFVVVVACNLTIFWKVSLSQKFKASALSTTTTTSTTTTGNQSQTRKTGKMGTDNSTPPPPQSTKEKALLRSITILCYIFVICFLPDTFLVIIIYGLGLPIHFYVKETAFSVINILEIFNSSTNIFIYYTMSSRFRDELRMALGLGKKSGQK